MARESRKKREERRFGRAPTLADMILGSNTKTDWGLPVFAARTYDEAQLGLCWDSVREIIDGLKRCPVISAVDACEVYWRHHRDVWSFTEDFPNSTPVFPEFFVESVRPASIVVDAGRTIEPAEWCPDRWGLFITANEVDAAERAELAKSVPLAAVFDASMRWVLRAMLVTATAARGLMFYPAFTFLSVDGDGRVLTNPVVMAGNRHIGEEEQQGIRSFSDSLLKPLLFSISFLHCKGVTLDTVEPDRDIDRERKKDGRRPFIRYQTIDVRPATKMLRVEGNIEANGLKKALHLCRGNFATYTGSFMGRPLEKPLTVWRPAHVRGDVKRGLVVSDYNVKAPKPQGVTS